MTQNRPPSDPKEPSLHVEVEEWQWQMPPSAKKLTWKHWLGAALFLVVALLLAFGFLLIAGIALVIGLVMSLIFFIIKKLP